MAKIIDIKTRKVLADLPCNKDVVPVLKDSINQNTASLLGRRVRSISKDELEKAYPQKSKVSNR